MSTSTDIHVDISSLLRFADGVVGVVERLVPRAADGVRAIEAGEGAIGAEPAFLEAARLRATGETTTVSARAFLDLLGGHLATLAEDARRAGLTYRTMDDDMAERTNLEREQVWRSTTAGPDAPGHIFALGRGTRPLPA